MTQTNQPSSIGTLSIVATPIGNLEDITLRALRVLKEADIVFAEDTRRTRILLSHFEINKRVEAYHAFNEHGKTPYIIAKVLGGQNVALVSDAGSPCIADPGFLLIREAVSAQIEPVIIPGVSAMTFAISASALPSDKFAFYAFLPVKSGRRTAAIERIAKEDKTCVVFESPYRVEKLLKEIHDLIGPLTPVALVREATKVHEEVLHGTVQDLIARTSGRTWKGECVLVIGKTTDEMTDLES